MLPFFLMFSVLGWSQITTVPELPVDNKALTITFNSAEEGRLGYFTGDLYAHTGVNIEGVGSWQHVIGDWGQNDAQPKLTHLGNGIYELEIKPDINTFYSVSGNEKVINISFVFRSADNSKQTNDLILTVYEEGLNVQLNSPANPSILELNTNYTFLASSSEEANLQFLINGDVVKTVLGKSISKDVIFDSMGQFWVKVIAEINGVLAVDSAFICIREEAIIETLPLGARKGISYPDNQSAQLVLWAPGKSHVYLLGDFNNWLPDNNYQMKKDGDYFWFDLTGLESAKEYLFQYFIDGEIRIADPYTEKVSDPWNDKNIPSSVYPNLIAYPEGIAQGIASVLQPGQNKYEWTITDFSIPDQSNMVIYELLIRDFSNEHSFKAVIEKLDYLEDLNINVLELMPINEFEGNSAGWGYDPSFYFATDKYYGTKNDLKALIDECHKRGIAVVIDMVLNHSYGQSPFVKMYWNADLNRPTADNPWYNEKSNFQNPDLQWGYDFNHDASPTRELIDSINSFWMSEFKVDGFRFDFTKGLSNTPYGASSWGSEYDASRISNLKRMADEIQKRKPGALMICEHLADNSEETELANYGFLLWGNMNHNYGEAAMGYNESNKSDLSWGVYQRRNWDSPNLITYQESHDEERLAYKCQTWGNASDSYNITELQTTLKRLELTALFHLPLPGPKMIWQFGELGYDIPINFDGRLGEKPVHWDYLDDSNRKKLFRTMASLNYLKLNYEEFTPDDFSYSLTGELKKYQLSKGNNHVIAIGNFALEEKTISVDFPKTGIWYNYFEEEAFEVNNSTMDIILGAGEYWLLSTRLFDKPTFNTKVEIENFSKNSIKVYPNPVYDQIYISGESIVGVDLLDLNGKIILSKKNHANETLFNFNLTSISTGLYFLRITYDQSTSVTKFIKK